MTDLGPWTGGTTPSFRFRRGDKVLVQGDRLQVLDLVVSSMPGYRMQNLDPGMIGSLVWNRDVVDREGVLIRPKKGRELGL